MGLPWSALSHEKMRSKLKNAQVLARREIYYSERVVYLGVFGVSLASEQCCA